MSTKPTKTSCWTDKEKSIANRLYEENKMYHEIQKELITNGFFRSTEAIRKFIKRQVKEPVVVKDTNIFSIPDKTKRIHVVEREDHIDALSMIEDKRQDIFDIVTEQYEKIGNPDGKLHKVVSISDLHIPWVNDNVIADMVSKHSDAEVLVVNGDFLDQFSISKWPKSKGVLLRHEYEIALEYVKEFSKTFKKVVLTRGNHDSRLESYFASNLSPNVCFMTSPDMLERIAEGYGFNHEGKLKKMFDFKNVFYGGGVSGWYAKVGKCIFAHPKGGSGIPMRTCVRVADYFLEKEDFEAVVIGHTHKMGKVIWKGKLLIEQGCCCVPMDYEADAKMAYSQQAFGYAIVYMNSKGQVHFDKSNPVYHGTATAVNTDTRISLGD